MRQYAGSGRFEKQMTAFPLFFCHPGFGSDSQSLKGVSHGGSTVMV
jgi:hypothetical protein